MPYVKYLGGWILIPDGYQIDPSSTDPRMPKLVPIGSGQPWTPPPPATPVPPAAPLTPSQLAWQNAKTMYEGKRKQLLQNYGLTETGQMDPANQFGQARQLLDRYGQQLELARMSNAGRGIGTRGLAHQRDRLIRHLLGGSTVALGQAFLGRLADIDYDIGKLGPKPVR